MPSSKNQMAEVLSKSSACSSTEQSCQYPSCTFKWKEQKTSNNFCRVPFLKSVFKHCHVRAATVTWFQTWARGVSGRMPALHVWGPEFGPQYIHQSQEINRLWIQLGYLMLIQILKILRIQVSKHFHLDYSGKLPRYKLNNPIINFFLGIMLG